MWHKSATVVRRVLNNVSLHFPETHRRNHAKKMCNFFRFKAFIYDPRDFFTYYENRTVLFSSLCVSLAFVYTEL